MGLPVIEGRARTVRVAGVSRGDVSLVGRVRARLRRPRARPRARVRVRVVVVQVPLLLALALSRGVGLAVGAWWRWVRSADVREAVTARGELGVHWGRLRRVTSLRGALSLFLLWGWLANVWLQLGTLVVLTVVGWRDLRRQLRTDRR